MNTIVIAVDAGERDRLFANTVRAMRQGLGITVPQLSRASSIPCPNIEAIEAGGTMTHAEHHDIAVALSWLSSIHAATALATSPMATPRLSLAAMWLDRMDCALSDRCSAALLRRAASEVGVAPQEDVKAAQHRDVADACAPAAMGGRSGLGSTIRPRFVGERSECPDVVSAPDMDDVTSMRHAHDHDDHQPARRAIPRRERVRT